MAIEFLPGQPSNCSSGLLLPEFLSSEELAERIKFADSKLRALGVLKEDESLDYT